MLYCFGRCTARVARAAATLLAVPILAAPRSDQVPVAQATTGDAPAREPAVEGRAIWVNRFEYNSAEEIRRILDRVASANFNVVYFQVRGQGDAYYRSDIEPCAIRLCGRLGNGTPPYDPLEIALREGHARGLQVHAWINAFPAWASPTKNNAAFCALLTESRPGSPRHMLLAHPEWVMTTRDGTPMDCYTSQKPEYAYVSPGIPAVRAHLARVAADIARRYAVDGIHLDRVRYPGPEWSYDEPTLAAFRARFGRAPAPSGDPDWSRFRREQVDAAVKAVFDSITAVRRDVALSAAVWPIHDRSKFGWPSSSAVSQFFQDARSWARGGYVDVLAPMAYFRVNEEYCSYALPGGQSNPDWACLLSDHQSALSQTGTQLYMGLWAGLGPDELARQIHLGRERRVDGFALYSYGPAAAAGLFDALRATIFRSPAAVPGVTRRD